MKDRRNKEHAIQYRKGEMIRCDLRNQVIEANGDIAKGIAVSASCLAGVIVGLAIGIAVGKNK